MKIHKDELDPNLGRETEVYNKIEEVILPFQTAIKSQNLNLYLGKEN